MGKFSKRLTPKFTVKKKGNIMRVKTGVVRRRRHKKILKAADSVIKNNTEQIFKTLWTKNHEGEPIVVFECQNEMDEANKVVNFIKQEAFFLSYEKVNQ